LEKHTGWATLNDVVASRMDALQRRRAGGNVTSMDEYKQLAGRLEGMREILGIRAVVRT
jgi:hypothetical protein